MIEQFDVELSSKNKTYQKFSSEHVKRYQIAKAIISIKYDYPIILDAACGYGYGYHYLKNIGMYIGLDINEKIIEQVRKRYPNGDFRVEDIMKMHYEYCPDVIISFETAEHLQDPIQFLKNIYKMLPDYGIFLFSVPTSLTKDFDQYHIHDWNKEKWLNILTDIGFHVNTIIPMPFETSFLSFLKIVNTSWKDKLRIVKFIFKNKEYRIDRIKNWLLKNTFYWESTMFVCLR